MIGCRVNDGVYIDIICVDTSVLTPTQVRLHTVIQNHACFHIS